jgi:ParB family chromosome partitioning protein
MELTAHRTLALRNALADNPHVALTALLHKLSGDFVRDDGNYGGCLEASVRPVSFPVQAPDLKETPAAKSIAERHEAWKADLPQDDQARWDWLASLDDASRLALLAHCVSFGVNALYEKPSPYAGASGVTQHGLDRRLAQADRLAQAVGLDMAEAGWVPTADNYLNRVPKRRILEAVREGAGARKAQLIEHLKKGDMATEAERLLAGSGWLPEPLRSLDSGAVEPASEGLETEVETLPEFLAGDDETAGEEADEAIALAAE